MNMKHPRAFVSSTYEDLKDHRAYVISQLRRCSIQVDPMEEWDAAPDPPKAFSTARIEGCDLFVLLIGLRLGHVPTGEIRSITQLEYDHARSLGVDILPFMLAKQSYREDKIDAPYTLEADEEAACQEWRKEICERYGVGFFTRAAESVPAATSVARWLISRQLPFPSTLSLNKVLLAHETRDTDVRNFFSGRPDLVKLAFGADFGWQHVVPDFRIGTMQFDYAIVAPLVANSPPRITYVSLKGCQDRLLGGAIGKTMDAIDRFLEDGGRTGGWWPFKRRKYPYCSKRRARMIEESLASREDYRELQELASYDFHESAVLVGGRRNTLSEKELEIMRLRNAGGRSELWVRTGSEPGIR
jgi:hypothetical protein